MRLGRFGLLRILTLVILLRFDLSFLFGHILLLGLLREECLFEFVDYLFVCVLQFAEIIS